MTGCPLCDCNSVRPLTDADREWLDQERQRHRDQGCRIFDEKLARCTCPTPTSEQQP